MRILIIGYGNTLRSDDALGILAAGALLRRPLPVDTHVLSCLQLTPELAQTLAEYDRAIFIDAAEAGDEPPGTIQRRPLLPDFTAPPGITHHFTPQTLLAMSALLYDHTPQAELITVSAASFDLGEELTPAVAAALPRLVNLILEITESPSV